MEDLVVIGAGLGGLTAARFGAQLGAQVVLEDLANSMHVYPSYGMNIMRMTADAAVANFGDSFVSRLLRRLAGFKTLP